MNELREMNVPALAFVAVGVAAATVLSFRGYGAVISDTHPSSCVPGGLPKCGGNDLFDAVNEALVAVLAGMVVLAIAIGRWSSSWWTTARWLVLGLMVFGWVLWLFAVVLAAWCSGLQSNAMLAEEKDPCGVVWLAVLGGFVFLLVGSFLTLTRWSDSRRQR